MNSNMFHLVGILELRKLSVRRDVQSGLFSRIPYMNLNQLQNSAPSRRTNRKKKVIGPLTLQQTMLKELLSKRPKLNPVGRRIPNPPRFRGQSQGFAFPITPDLSQSVAAPVSLGKVRRTNDPLQRGLANGDLIVSHREYILDVPGSVAFSVTQNSVNPGLPGLFPWLSGVAQRFESYKFEALKFDFETESATSATGTALLALDYDASDAAPTSKTQAMAYRSSVRSPAWSNCQLTSLSEDLNKQKSYFVRRGAVPASADVKMYDVGNLNVCTIGQANTNIIGELYVEYRIRLMTPQLGIAGQGESIWGNFQGTVNTAPFAQTIAGNLPAAVGSTGSTTSVTTWTFSQPWQGLVTLIVDGTGLSTSTFTGTATSSITTQVVNAGATSYMTSGPLSAAIGQTFIVTVSDTTISLGIANFAQSGTSV